MKRWAFRSGLVLVLIALGVFLFVLGKEHVVFVDNLELTVQGVTYSPTGSFEVWIDGVQVGRTAIAPGKRNVLNVPGPKHLLELQEMDGNEPVGPRIEQSFKIDALKTQVIINLPALLAGSDAFLYPVQ